MDDHPFSEYQQQQQLRHTQLLLLLHITPLCYPLSPLSYLPPRRILIPSPFPPYQGLPPLYASARRQDVICPSILLFFKEEE